MASAPSIGPLPPTFNHNLLTNPGFEVWQRGAGPFAANQAYAADRWQISLGAGSSMSVSKDTTNQDAGSAACAAVTYTQGTAASIFVQPINGDQPQLFGRTLTLSIRVKCATANAVQVYLYDNVAGNRVGASHPGDGAYHTLVATAAISATATVVQVGVNLSASCTAYVDNATLVVGGQPIPYVPFHPAEDLHRCQRYYEVLGDAASGNLIIDGYAGGAGVLLYTTFPYKAAKPVPPTITVQGTWNNSNATAAPAVVHNNTMACLLSATSAASGNVFTNNTGASSNIVVEANP